MKNLFDHLPSLLVEAVELHVHGLDELGGDLSANCRWVLLLKALRVVLGVGLVIFWVLLQEGCLGWCPVGHGEVLMHRDVVVQVLVVVDGITGVACHVVEVDMAPLGIFSNSMIQTQKVFTFLTHGGILPVAILNGDLVLVVVDLDVECLQDRSADQQWCAAFHNEGLDVASSSFYVDWKSD